MYNYGIERPLLSRDLLMFGVIYPAPQIDLKATAKRLNLMNRLVSCPARARLPVRNGLVNEVEFLGLITQTW